MGEFLKIPYSPERRDLLKLMGSVAASSCLFPDTHSLMATVEAVVSKLGSIDAENKTPNLRVSEDFEIPSDLQTRKENTALAAGPSTFLGKKCLLSYEYYKPDPMGSIYKVQTVLITVTEEGVQSQQPLSILRTPESKNHKHQSWERSPSVVYSSTQDIYWLTNWRNREEDGLPRIEFTLIDSQGQGEKRTWVGENQDTWKQGTPDIALTPEGSALIVWSETNKEFQTASWGLRFQSDGTPLDELPFQIPGVEDQTIVNSKVIYNPYADNFAVIGVYPFIDNGKAAVYIFGSLVPKEGTIKNLQPQLVDGRATDKSVRLDTAILPRSGRIAVVWEEMVAGALGSLIQAQILSPDNLEIDSPDPKKTPLTLHQQKEQYFHSPQLNVGKEEQILAWEQFAPWQFDKRQGFAMPLNIEQRTSGRPVRVTEKESSQRNIALTEALSEDGRFAVWIDTRSGFSSEIRGATIFLTTT